MHIHGATFNRDTDTQLRDTEENPKHATRVSFPSTSNFGPIAL